MSDRIKDYFLAETTLDHDKEGGALDRRLQVAIVVVLCFMGHVDAYFVTKEFDIIVRIVSREFHLMDDEASELVEIAQILLKNPTKLQESIALLNEHLSEEQRKHVLSIAWNVALADGLIQNAEENLWRKLQGALQIYT